MTVVAVVTVKNGCAYTYTKDDDDYVVTIDVDNLMADNGDCPVCIGPMEREFCDNCKIDWTDYDLEEIAMKILREEP